MARLFSQLANNLKLKLLSIVSSKWWVYVLSYFCRPFFLWIGYRRRTFRWIIAVLFNYQFNPQLRGLDRWFAGNSDNFVIAQHHTGRQNVNQNQFVYIQTSTFPKHSNISGWLCRHLKSFYSKPRAITADNSVLFYYQYNPFRGCAWY